MQCTRGLNPNAQKFYPQSKQQIEALPNLPEYLFDWERNDQIDDNNAREREEAATSQNEGTHYIPKLNEGEKEKPIQLEEIKVDPVHVHQEAKPSMQFGSFPEFLLTNEYWKNDPSKLSGQKDQQKDKLLNTVKTDKSAQSSISSKGGKEKQHYPSQQIKQKKEKQIKTEETVKPAHQNAVRKSLDLGKKEEIESTASLKTSNSDITYKEKLLEGEAELTEKTMAVKSQHQSTSSSSSPKEQLQKDHQKKKPIPSVKAISPRFGEERTEMVPVIKAPETGKDSIDHRKVAEKNKYDPLKTGQTQIELEENNDNENKGQSVAIKQDQGSRPTEQSSKGKSQKNRPKSKSSKGKKAITPAEAERLKKEKEKEENELLRQFKKEADEERLKMEKLKEIENQKLVEIVEKLKMHKEKDQELRNKKQMLDNKIGGIEKIVQQNPSTAVQGHGEASGSSSGAAGGGGVQSNFAANQRNAFLSALSDVPFLGKVQKKFKEIKDLLKRLQEKLNEVKKLEYDWVIEKSKNLITKLNHQKESTSNDLIKISKEENEISKNLKQYRNTITQLIIEEDKLKKLNDKLAKLRQMELSKTKNLIQVIYEMSEISKNIAEQQKIIDNLEIDIDKFMKLLIEEFIKMKEPETEEIKMIEKNMEEPMKNLWNLHNLVLLALNQIWNEPGFREHHGFEKPYQFIEIVFHYTPLSITEEDQSEFDNTMKLTLEKMLTHQNIYRTMDLKTNVNGKSVYEMLNCFDELSEKMNRQVEADEKFSGSNAKHMEEFGKFIKNEVNEHIREAFRFIMVGLDEVPDVSDQMALDGIKKLMVEWLPKNRKRQMNVIWTRLFIYYYDENGNLNILRHNDKLAEDVFDLIPVADKEEENIRKQLSKIYEFRFEMSTEFSFEIIKFMLNVFQIIENLFQSINMLVKIEKRMNDAKPLPYLKSVYDKYWYIIYRERFYPLLNFVRMCQYGRKQNQTENVKNDIKNLSKEYQNKIKETEKIFNQIDSDKPDILDRLMEVIDSIKEFLKENKIMNRAEKYENDEDFMKSVSAENPNLKYFHSLLKKLKGNSNEQ